MTARCTFGWGIHRCSLLPGDHRFHLCVDDDGVCSEYDRAAPAERRIRFMTPGGWGPWRQYGLGGYGVEDDSENIRTTTPLASALAKVDTDVEGALGAIPREEDHV